MSKVSAEAGGISEVEASIANAKMNQVQTACREYDKAIKARKIAEVATKVGTTKVARQIINSQGNLTAEGDEVKHHVHFHIQIDNEPRQEELAKVLQLSGLKLVLQEWIFPLFTEVVKIPD